MAEHRSHPDQLMAQALGVCWHSPTSDRWPCGPIGATDEVAAEAEAAHDAAGWQQAVDWHAGYAAGLARAATDSPRWCATCESYGDHHTDRHGA